MEFSLKQRTPLQEVINVPPASAVSLTPSYYVGYNNQTTAPVATGLPFDHTAGIQQRYNATQVSYSAAAWFNNRQDPLTVFESPSFVAKVHFVKSTSLYIPYGQAAKFNTSTRIGNISYRGLEIKRPEEFEAPAAADGDSTVTPYLPAGWPIFVMKVQAQRSSATLSTANPSAADAYECNMRGYYQIPDCPGRFLITTSGSLYTTGVSTAPSTGGIYTGGTT